MRHDWSTEVLDRERIIILFVNYTFFAIVFLICFLFVVCCYQTTSNPSDIITSLMLVAFSFLVVNIVIADYVVYILKSHKELKPIL
jgi:hypothetical protein